MSAEPRWNVTTATPRAARARSSEADPDRNAARVLSAITLASLAAGAINIAAAATVARGSAQGMAFFVVVAAAQLVWAAVALVRAPRWWLALGAAGNLVVVAIWVVSRTAGLPSGVFAGGTTLPAKFPDTLATILEAVVVIGAAALMVRGRDLARSAAHAPGITAAATVVAGVLTIFGVLAQAGVIGSSSGSTQNGPGVNGPAAPGGGTGTSGGTGTTGGTGNTGGGYGY
ncbi:MAG TPA: hypothetical protein VH589_29690 [Trebonia sp.]|jgi:hypothetical protein